MPLHDWSRVTDNVFHNFHVAWLAGLSATLNRSVLPEGYVARAEEYVGPYEADVLTLQLAGSGPASDRSAALQPTATIAPPRFDVWKQRRIAVFSSREERRVAVLDVVSPGNKSSDERASFFREKLLACLANGLHVLLIDVHPATRIVPGFAATVARELGGADAVPAEGRAATSFERRTSPSEVRVYHCSLQIGSALPELPLFLEPGVHVMVPAEQTYQEAMSGLPAPDRAALRAR